MTKKKFLINYLIFGLFVVLTVSFASLVIIKQTNLLIGGSTSSLRLENFSLATPQAFCSGQTAQVILNWIKSTNAQAYLIQTKLSSQRNWRDYRMLSASQLAFTDNLNNFTQAINYRVKASAGKSTQYSNQVTANPINCTVINPPVTPPPSSATSSKVKWGAYVGDAVTDAAAFETRVGHKMNLQAIFVGFGDDFPSSYKSTVSDQGKSLVIFWEPYNTSLSSIISGLSDSYINKFAAAAKAYGGQVILAPFHEMNGNWDTWDGTVGTNTPAKVIQAWQHLHNLFSGVTNVKFGWTVNHESVPDTTSNQLENYYPGDAYVDYVGVDGFNFDNPWQSFSQVFDNALSRLAVYHKPIYLFSFACAEGATKPAWITDALTVQIPKHPEIAGWIWFNSNKEKDWRVWSDQASLQAFNAALP